MGKSKTKRTLLRKASSSSLLSSFSATSSAANASTPSLKSRPSSRDRGRGGGASPPRSARRGVSFSLRRQPSARSARSREDEEEDQEDEGEDENKAPQTVTLTPSLTHTLKRPFSHFAHKEKERFGINTHALSREEAAIRIQTVWRRCRARRRVQQRRLLTRRERYQAQFDTLEKLRRFTITQHGAALRLQRWLHTYPCWRAHNKRRWRRKFAKLLAKAAAQKRFFPAIVRWRVRGFLFREEDFSVREKYHFACAVVMNRVVRGFLGRRRFLRIKRETEHAQRERERAIHILQRFLRKQLAIRRYPDLGRRYRLYAQKKQRGSAISFIQTQQTMREKERLRESENSNQGYSQRENPAEESSSRRGAREQELFAVEEEFEEGQERLSEEETEKLSDSIEQALSSQIDQDTQVYLLSRRITHLFPYLRLSDDIDALSRAALVIQRNWRRYHASFAFKRLVHTRNVRCARKIFLFYKRWRWRRKFYHTLSRLESLWQYNLWEKRRRFAAACAIQSRFRVYSKRKWLRNILDVRRFCAKRITQWVKRCRAVRVRRQCVVCVRRDEELRTAGESLLKETERRWRSYFYWQGLKKHALMPTNSGPSLSSSLSSSAKMDRTPYELPRFFSAHAVSGGLDLSKIIKLCKDCPGLITSASHNNSNNKSSTENNNSSDISNNGKASFSAKDGFPLSLNTVELLFTKSRANPAEKRLDFPCFVNLLASLALHRFCGTDTLKGLWDERQRESDFTSSRGAAVRCAPEALQDTRMEPEEVHNYSYGALRGKMALVVRFIDIFLSQSPEFQRIVEVLGSKSAMAQSISTLSASVYTLQRFVRNRFAVIRLTRELQILREKKARQHRERAACVMQRRVRGVLARRRCTRLAQQMYSKYIDGESERVYWSNARTGVSLWTKPSLLREEDCGLPVRIPPPLEVYAIYCRVCEEMIATCYCEACACVYCTPCYATHHSSGQRKTHSPYVLDTCVQCSFQVGTRLCLTCHDLFCDSCYHHTHKKGRLRFHTYTQYGPKCESCVERAAQWRERLMPHTQGENSLTERLWCGVCYFNTYAIVPQESVPSSSSRNKNKNNRKTSRANTPKNANKGSGRENDNNNNSTNANTLERVEYFGRAHFAQQEKEKQRRKEEEIKQLFAQRQEELHRQHCIRCAMFIQRVYRGFYARLRVRAYIAERKHFLAMRATENTLRASLLYKLRVFLGFPPYLESDTPLERVQKLYPWYMRDIVAACIDNQWSEACRLMSEHDDFLKAIQQQQQQEKEQSSSFKNQANNKNISDQKKKRVTLVEKLLMKWQLHRAKERCKAAQREVDEKSAMVDNASKSYYEAQMSGAVSESKLKKMKKALNKLEKEKQKTLDKQAEYEKRLSSAQETVVCTFGPRRLQRVIEQRRREGLLLPFRVKLTRNSRHAQVVQWISFDTNDPLDPRNPNPFAGLLQSIKNNNSGKNNNNSDGNGNNEDNDSIDDSENNSARFNDDYQYYYNDGNNNNNGNNEEGEFYYEIDENGMPVMRSAQQDTQFYDDAYMASPSQRQPPFDNTNDNANSVNEYYNSALYGDNNAGLFEEGAWQRLIKAGDELYIHGNKYTVCVSATARKKKNLDGQSSSKSRRKRRGSSAGSTRSESSFLSSENESESERGSDRGSDRGSEDEDNSSRPSSSRPNSASRSSKKSTASSEDNTPRTDTEEDVNMEREVQLAITEDHITLDRPWLFEDAELVEVYKVMPRVFYAKPFIFLKDMLLASYPVQKSTAVLAITMHKTSRLCERIASLFDEESNQRARLTALSRRALCAKYYWLSFSHSLVQMSYDFTLRRYIGKLFYSFYLSLGKIVETGASVYDTFTTSHTETPYEYWMHSFEKETVLVFFAYSKEQVNLLGELRMDAKMPLEITREYLYRNFRDKLNETVGESFLFTKIGEASQNIEMILPREDEFRITLKEFSVMKTDSKTLLTQPSITVVKDRERARVFIPPFTDDIAEREAKHAVEEREVEDMMGDLEE